MDSALGLVSGKETLLYWIWDYRASTVGCPGLYLLGLPMMYCQCCLMYRFSMHLQIAPSKQNNKQKMLKKCNFTPRLGGVWGMPLLCWNDATFCMNSPVDCDNCQRESGGTRVRHRVALLLILFHCSQHNTTRMLEAWQQTPLITSL